MGSWRSSITGDTMRGLTPFLCLLGLVCSMDMMEPETNKMVHDMVDVIESGLSEHDERDPRALFISLTLTSTSTNLATATVTSTVTASCYTATAASLDACTTTTTTTTTTSAASTGRKKRSAFHYMNMKDKFMNTVHDFAADAKVTVDGEEVDINMILPTSSHATEARSDFDDLNAGTMFTNNEAPGLMSGSMEWNEVAVAGGRALHNGCGRSDALPEKRPRIIALANEVVTKDLTSTETVTETAATTKTFTVELACTPSGFTFAIASCTAATG